MNILKAVNLRKIYGQGETEVRALDGINLEVEKGEFVAIVGTSGSGKSTLLHIIGGLDNPTSGQVIVDGQNLSHMTDEELTIFRRRNIGFVFQQYNLVPMLNVWENIVLPVKLDGKKIEKGYVNEIIDTLGIRTKLENLPSALSGGQQQDICCRYLRSVLCNHLRQILHLSVLWRRLCDGNDQTSMYQVHGFLSWTGHVSLLL